MRVQHKIETTPTVERLLFFGQQVNQKSINDLIEKIVKFNTADDIIEKQAKLNEESFTRIPIKIYIDSYGGTVYQVLGLISVIEKSKTPIHTYLTGCAMSSGFMMFISGHERFAHRYSTALYHQVSAWTSGKLEEMKESVEEAARLQKIIEKIVLEKTQIKKTQIEKANKEKRDWYIPANDLVKLGIADKIL